MREKELQRKKGDIYNSSDWTEFWDTVFPLSAIEKLNINSKTSRVERNPKVI